MPLIGSILLATLVVSSISLVGILFTGLKESPTDHLLEYFVSFAAGGLLGGAFLHLLPEAAGASDSRMFSYVLSGILVFFFVEKFLKWRHCHAGHCDAHTFTYVNLIGDGVHNFIDGMVIAASFAQDIRLGVATTVAVAIHEIPQEIGDYAILVYGGFGKRRALAYNFLSALLAILGAVTAFFFLRESSLMKTFLIPFTAGGFIYLALVDLMPELHKISCYGKRSAQIAALLAGLGLMGLLKTVY